MKRIGAGVALAGALLLTGCGASGLEPDDPQGYKACQYYEKSSKHQGEIEQGLGNLLLAGEAASKAKTESIRNTADAIGAENGPKSYMADGDELRSACAEAGYEFKD